MFLFAVTQGVWNLDLCTIRICTNTIVYRITTQPEVQQSPHWQTAFSCHAFALESIAAAPLCSSKNPQVVEVLFVLFVAQAVYSFCTSLACAWQNVLANMHSLWHYHTSLAFSALFSVFMFYVATQAPVARQVLCSTHNVCSYRCLKPDLQKTQGDTYQSIFQHINPR